MSNMNVIEIGKQLQKYLEDNGLTQQQLAIATNTDQSYISRILRADFTRITKKVRDICEYARLDLDSHTNPADNPALIGALDWVWDGSEKKAKALAKVIRSLKELA
jgi:transcriptional regulator with XRE-family HTH domain